MTPDAGNWVVLTHNCAQGHVQELSWSRDGARIYFDRKTGVTSGVFSISVYGGDEHTVLQDAESPQTLPDGSLLLLRRERLSRYWPQTGQLHPLPVEVLKSDAPSEPIRVFPDGRTAVMVGRPILPTPYPSARLLLLVDLVVGSVRVLDNGDPPVSLAVAADGKSVLAGNPLGEWNTIEVSALGRAQRKRLSLRATHAMHLDIGPDGSLYTDQGLKSGLWRFQGTRN
jgi:hypothetical protein